MFRICKAVQEFSGPATEKKSMTKKGLIDNIVSGKYQFSNESERSDMLQYLTSTEPKQKKTWTCILCPNLIFDKKRDQVIHTKRVHGQIKRFSCIKCNKLFQVSNL